MRNHIAIALLCGILLTWPAAAFGQEIKANEGDTITVQARGKSDQATVAGSADKPVVRFVSWVSGRWQPIAQNTAFNQPLAIEVDYSNPQNQRAITISAELNDVALDGLPAERLGDDQSLFRTRAFKIVPGSPADFVYTDNPEPN